METIGTRASQCQHPMAALSWSPDGKSVTCNDCGYRFSPVICDCDGQHFKTVNALQKYGKHLSDCGFWLDAYHKCSCGLDEAVKGLQDDR